VTPQANGRTSLRNVQVNVRGEARLGDGVRVDAQAGAETGGAGEEAVETRQPD